MKHTTKKDTRIYMKNANGTKTTIRPNSKTLTTVNGYGGFTLEAYGTKKFNNKEHKGYKLYSFDVLIGYCDSLLNRDNLEILVNTTVPFGAKKALKFCGGISINEAYLYLFDGVEDILKQYPIIKETLSATDMQDKLKGVRKRARRRY